MEKIIFISQNSELTQRYRNILSTEKYDFLPISDERTANNPNNGFNPDIIIFDEDFPKVKSLIKSLKSYANSAVFILLSKDDNIDLNIAKDISAFLTRQSSDSFIKSTIMANCKTKNSLDKLSQSNKDLADSLYRLNVLYSTSSQFAGTLDTKELIDYMIEGLDKSLSFDLTCTLCIKSEPILLLNSLYEISEELLSAIKQRVITNYNSLDDETKPVKDLNNIKVIKTVKYPAKMLTFEIFEYDNMFAPINLGDKLFGCIEIFKQTAFSADDATYFQTIVQQVSVPLKSATLYQELIETNHKLEKLEHLKSEFISIVSHELRTPLTAIKNSLDILNSGKCGELNDAGQKFLIMAQRNVMRLSGIINDLLDLSKIEAGKMEYKFNNMNIHSVIEYVKTSLSGLAKEKGLNLISEETENLPDIYADSGRLEQVLTNLVSNAIKFTPAGKNITIRSNIADASQLTCADCFTEDLKKLNGEYIVVCVEDEGIGIAKENLHRAFDKFAQIENSLLRKVGGSGLGLPIAKQLLEAHQGTIWCDSELEKGSKFYFALPVAKVEAKEVSATV